MSSHVENIEKPERIEIGQIEKADDIDDEAGHDNKMSVLVEAQLATVEEHTMKLWDAIKMYPYSCFWSIVFSTALIMEGFDHAFISGFFAFPEFKQKYGTLTKDGTYQIPAAMQSGITNGISAGQVVGLMLNGYLSDIIGYRWVMIGSLVLMTGFIFLQFFANSLKMYLGAEILLGVPWGVFQALTTTYASEVCPLVLRPYLTMMVSLFWSVGYFIGSGALRGFLKMEGQWAYRIPFALQWIWPIPLIILIYIAPESPWWLVRRNKLKEAEKVVGRLLVPRNADPEETDKQIDQQISMMIHTNSIENELKKSATFTDCFRGIDLRRTEIALVVYVIQNMCSPLFGVSTYFLEQAGLSTVYAYDFTIIQYSLAILGVFIAWFLSSRVGRRTLYMWGLGFNVFSLLLIGILGIPSQKTHKNLSYGIGSLLLVQYFVFFITVAPLTYSIVTEIPSNKLRSKTVVLGRAAYNIISVFIGQLNTRMVQKSTWGWGAKTGFFWGGLLAFFFVWAFFRVPETQDRTFAEMDILFKNKVKASKFRTTGVDLATEEVFEREDETNPNGWKIWKSKPSK